MSRALLMSKRRSWTVARYRAVLSSCTQRDETPKAECGIPRADDPSVGLEFAVQQAEDVLCVTYILHASPLRLCLREGVHRAMVSSFLDA